MASQASFSVERLQRYASEAVRKIRRKWTVPHTVALTCQYVGVAVEGGRFDESAVAQSSFTVGFEWGVKADANEHTQVVTVRCDHVAGRGVPLPSWQTALQNLDLADHIRQAVERVTAQSGTQGASCHYAGHPRPASLSEKENTPGAIVAINGIEHVMCAHILDGQWLLHCGSIYPEWSVRGAST